MKIIKSKKQSTIQKISNLNKLLEIIDYLDVTDKRIVVGLKKDLFIFNKGSSVFVNRGVNVTFANEIHFNPDIPTEKILQENLIENIKESINKEN